MLTSKHIDGAEKTYDFFFCHVYNVEACAHAIVDNSSAITFGDIDDIKVRFLFL